jgi:tripartite-type tricarboxylate transporter receptor subunit TctC
MTRHASTLTKRRFTAGLLTTVLAVAGTGLALAQQYPSRAIEWVVMWPAGGGADTATRTLLKFLEPELGQKVVVRNIVGGGGSIGYMASKQARPDGYNLITINADLAKFTPMQLASIKVDDFDLVGSFAGQSPIIIARADSPWKSIAEFVEDAKRNPGQRTIGVSDIGGIHHQPVVLWAQKAGIKVRPVAHAGSPQMNAAILGGHVDLVSSYVRPAAPYIKEGKLRFLGYFGPNRLEDYPDTPTFKELGYDVVWEMPYGIGGPAGLPETAKKRLAEATAKVLKKPELKTALENLGLQILAQDGPTFKAYLSRIESEIAQVMKILKEEK